jgi:imidazolonepropionase-like amidohydrolase
MNVNKIYKSSLVCLALMSATSVFADSLAIVNATVHTVTEQGILNQATVIVDNGVIIAINPEEVSADVVFDAKGQILTPGLIGTMNQLGLVEVSAVSRTRDASDKKADITFDPSIAFNPKSSVIPYSRKGGITSNVVVPRGGEDEFKGQAFIVNLSGDFDSVVDTQSAAIVQFGAKSEGSRALTLQKIFRTFEDAHKKMRNDEAKKNSKDANKNKITKGKSDSKEPKRVAKAINKVLLREQPLLAYADRASDILQLIKLKETYDIDIVIAGARDAASVASQLAKADIPIVYRTLTALPSFDALHVSLSSTASLVAAGVTVCIRVDGDTHNLYQLRFDAGIAVANGLTKDQALAAVTANIADAFNYNAGRIAVGKKADLVLWSADPFELSTRVEKMWIDGQEQEIKSRQDALRDRYMSTSAMPRAYSK